jgi:hypothetical protein
LRHDKESRLKIGTIIVAVCVLVAVTFLAVHNINDRQRRLSPEGLLRSYNLKQDKVVSDALRDRVNELASSRCLLSVNALLEQNQVERISSVKAISSDLKSDLDLCLARGIMAPYARDQLKDAGLLDFLTHP